jgi:hypothetical protein
MSEEEPPRCWRIRHRESLWERFDSIVHNRPRGLTKNPDAIMRIFHSAEKTVAESDGPLLVSRKGGKVFIGAPGIPPIGVSERGGVPVLELPVKIGGRTRYMRVWHEPGMTVAEVETT